MKPILLEGTSTTFRVYLDKGREIFEFEGRSRPEDVIGFFEPIFNWFKEYEKQPNKQTVIKFKLDYFNSSTAKVLLRFLAFIERMYKNNIDIKVEWYYIENDEDMLDVGQDFESLISIPFEFVEIEEDN
jgi:hypothetical protein